MTRSGLADLGRCALAIISGNDRRVAIKSEIDSLLGEVGDEKIYGVSARADREKQP